MLLANSHLILTFAVGAAAVYNGLAVTPQMGWDNWNAFGCDVSEELLLGTARKIAQFGLKDVGYEYVVLDDCWSLPQRGKNDRLRADPKKFPRGMKQVADKIHDLGLKFGMYSSAGTLTCGRYLGSLGYEEVDAKTFASWGVDYLKYDNCYNEGQSGTPLITYNRYKKMSDALNATGRPILYSMCNWNEDYPYKWAQTIANSWRMSGDITDSFDMPDVRCPCSGDEGYNCVLPGFHCSMMNILNKVTPFVDKGIPGAWNDLDMLEVGNGGMSDSQYRLHFTMWAAVKSPLLMGNDIRSLSGKSFSILTNPAVIAINQDPAGSSAVRRWRYYVDGKDRFDQGEIQMWSGSLENGDYVVVLLNAARGSRHMNATLADIFVDSGGARSDEASMTWDMFDLWANRMDDDMASKIVSGKMTPEDWSSDEVAQKYFNATETSYKQGLAKNMTILNGKWAGSVEAHGQIEAKVPAYDVAAYRLKPRKTKHQKDEL